MSKFHSNQTGRRKIANDLLDLLGSEEGETVQLWFMLKLLKEAVHASRHSTNRSVSVIMYIQPRRGEERRQVPFHEDSPQVSYTGNELLEIRSDCTMAC